MQRFVDPPDGAPGFVDIKQVEVDNGRSRILVTLAVADLDPPEFGLGISTRLVLPSRREYLLDAFVAHDVRVEATLTPFFDHWGADYSASRRVRVTVLPSRDAVRIAVRWRLLRATPGPFRLSTTAYLAIEGDGPHDHLRPRWLQVR